MADSTTAYERHAFEYLRARDRSNVGAIAITHWADSLAPDTEVLEIGCGGGFPVTRALVDAGLKLWAIDSSSTLVSTFKTRFPDVPVDCAEILESTLFDRQFDAAIAIGLIFLLDEEDQAALIHRMAEVIVPSGRFLFTAPVEIGRWEDITTGHTCLSLGRERYESILADAGFRAIATFDDEGRNNHYDAERVLA